MSEWKEYKLGDICDLIAGFAFKSKDFGNYNHKVVKIKDIKPPFISLDSISYVDISKYDEKKLAKYIVKKGDFLLAMTGATIGKLGKYIYSEPSYLNQRVLNIIPHYDVDKDFIYFSISSDYFQSYVINHVDSESAQPNISANTIGKYPIFLPDLDEQRKISSIFRNIENKIICNRKINENLEQQAQALFKSWFVDFEPFKNGEFEESELGRIPKGWKVGKLSEIVELRKPSIKPNEGTLYTHYSIPAFDKSKNPSTDEGFSIKSNKFGLSDNAVLLSKLNPSTRRIWYTGIVPENSVSSTEFLPFYSKKQNFTPFVYCYLNCDNNYIEIAKGAKGTTNSHQRIDANSILNRTLAYSEEVINAFCDCCQGIMNLILEKKQEIQTLSQLRDTLLPKLMSGELKVNEI